MSSYDPPHSSFIVDTGNNYEYHDPYRPISPSNFGVRVNNYTIEDYDAKNMSPVVRDDVSEFNEKEEADDNNDLGMEEPDNIIYATPSFFLSNTNLQAIHVPEFPND